jgi:hypothetical protein
MMGLALVAMFAVAAVASATASAAGPEWGQCYEKAGGKYADAGCQTKAKAKTGHYEWRKSAEVVHKKFTGKNTGSNGGILTTELYACNGTAENGRLTRKKCEEKGFKQESVGEISVECTEEVNSGEAFGKDDVRNVSVKFTGCKALETIPCSNGPVEGEIQVQPLKGVLGYITTSPKKVGVLLEPAKKKGNFAQFNCGGFIGTVVGVGNSKEGAYYEPEKTGGNDGIISPIEPINQMTSELTQVYTVNHELHQNIPSAFEGKKLTVLEDYIYLPSEPSESDGWSPAGEEITNVNTPEEEVEIKA